MPTTTQHDKLSAAILAFASKYFRTSDSAKRVGKQGAWTDERFTLALAKQHLNGGPARGLCPISKGSSVTLVGILDFDSHHGESTWVEMSAAAMEVAEQLESMQCKPVLFRSSGGRGIHLYLFWAEPQDAYSVRQMLIDVLGLLDYRNGTGGVKAREIEVFPKQDSVGTGPKDRGTMILLPLAGKSAPLVYEDDVFGMLVDQPKESFIVRQWPESPPVMVQEKPTREMALLDTTIEPIEKVRSALFSIPNDGGADSPNYEQWHRYMCAVHEALGASKVAYDLCREWSMQNKEAWARDPTCLEKRVWKYLKSADKRGSAITRRTIYHAATAAGWTGTPPDDVGFEDVEPETVDKAKDAQIAAEGKGVPKNRPRESNVGGPVPAYLRNEKTNMFKATAFNLNLALQHEGQCGMVIVYDNFLDQIMVLERNPDTGKDMPWRPFGDEDYFRLKIKLESTQSGITAFEPIPQELLRSAVYAVAKSVQFDSAQLWIGSLKWDGTKRVEQFLSKYCKAKDTPLNRAISRYIWTALAGRIISPGVKVDIVPIFAGPQGLRKSSAVMAMAPCLEQYGIVSFHDISSPDISRRLRGRTVVEIAELSGLHTREREAIKSWVTTSIEDWVPKYKEFSMTYKRRFVCIGTTNQDQLFSDDTGERRWTVVEILEMIDVDSIIRDREQLYAEAAALFNDGGVDWQEVQSLSVTIHNKFAMVDPWMDKVSDFFKLEDILNPGKTIGDRERLYTTEILEKAIGIEPKNLSRREEMRISSILQKLGRKKIRVRDRDSGRLRWTYVPTSADVPTCDDEVGTLQVLDL